MSSVTDDINAIIARAMTEYAQRHPESSFTSSPVYEVTSTDSTPTSTEAAVWDSTYQPGDTNIVAENSTSILVDEVTSRFSGAIWYDAIKEQDVLLAGLGGIGSYVAFLLSRLKVSLLTLVDRDVVETGNMSGQLYNESSIGMNKTMALSRILRDFSEYYSVNCYSENYSSRWTSKVMICGFDNMAARRQFFEAWKTLVDRAPREEKKEYLFIDGRLAAETFQVLCIRGDCAYNIARYEREFLFSDSEADATVCSYKQTTFMANMIGSIIVNLFVNFVANTFCDVLVPRDLPFLTEYSADTMYFKVVS